MDDAHERSLMPVLNHVQYSLELVDHLGSRKFAFDQHAHCGRVSVDEQRFDHHYVTIPIYLLQQHGRGWVALKVFKSDFLVSCLKFILVHFYCYNRSVHNSVGIGAGQRSGQRSKDRSGQQHNGVPCPCSDRCERNDQIN